MAPYGIAVDMARRSLRVTLAGFWDVPTVTNYIADLASAGASVARGGAASWWLIDMGEPVVQSGEVAAIMRDSLPAVFPPGATLAVVVNASLPAMQAKRVVPNAHHRHFATVAEAERWLTDQGMPA